MFPCNDEVHSFHSEDIHSYSMQRAVQCELKDKNGE